MTENPRLIAREYRRLSDDQGGTSIEDQGDDNESAADDNGWEMGEPYIDKGYSASRYARRTRDDFDRLVADLNSGPTGRESRFGADILMLWESSRGSRRVGEWVSFIELCEDKGVLIWVTTHERLYDPRNGRDRKTLIDDASDSEYESYKTHKRVSRTTVKEAKRGRPHGKAPYGLMPVYDPKTGELENWVEDLRRSIVPRELFRLLELHVPMGDITRRFAKRGYTNREGNPFSHEHLASMARRGHSYTGIRVYKGTHYEAIWDAIVPRTRFWNVQRLLNTPGRATYRGGGTRHVLTAGLRCSKCDNLLRVQNENSKTRSPSYRCIGGCLHILKEPVDDLIIGQPGDSGLLLEYLAREDIYEVLAAPASDDATVLDIQARLATARAERDEMREAKGRNLAEVQVLANSLAAKEEEVAVLEARERELTLPSAVLSIIKPGVDVWKSWQAAPIAGRRALVRLILAPGYLGVPYILPSPRSGRNQPPVIERIEWRHVRGVIPGPADGQ